VEKLDEPFKAVAAIGDDQDAEALQGALNDAHLNR
jgi:hypothetical protein